MLAGTTDAHTYPVEPWRITESVFHADPRFLEETLFALGNGYIGLRGTHEEGYRGRADTSLDGSYLNGFYESAPIHYPETAFGLAKTNQFILNVPNGKCIALWVGDERFDPLDGTLEAYTRVLDLRTGRLSRTMTWASRSGRRVAVSSERIVCFEHKHLYAIRFRITPLNFSGQVRLVSALDGDVSNIKAGDDPRVGSAEAGTALVPEGAEQSGDFSALRHRTRNSGFALVSAIAHDLSLDGAGSRDVVLTPVREHTSVAQHYALEVVEGQSLTLDKFGVYFSSRDFPEAELMPRARAALAEAKKRGFDALCAEQEAYLAAFWAQADVEIAGDDALQQAMHFNQFHLLQSVGRDGKTNIAAKGVTGEGYEGHYFWDTEIYVFPFFLFNKPEIARALLAYRYAGLNKARERARQMAHPKGALYPWRTIAGEECSSYFPAGTAQFHINADIAYAIRLYLDATGDDAFLRAEGAEIVMETARIWIGIGCHTARGFCIHAVTGPDEYTAIVDNNYYTNAMAQMHLHLAADLAEQLRQQYPDDFARIAGVIGLDPEEVAEWRRAATAMVLPYDAALGIHPQDDSFLSKKRWDFANTPADQYPLLLHFHPLVIYRHQVCKQADVVLAMLLLGEHVAAADKRRNFDYYEAVTTHDSSLSTCIFSIIASEIGEHDKAYDYFLKTARLDLDDMHGNTGYGVHTAAMAGTWLSVAYGFAGMRLHGGRLQFAPTLPARWTHYQFRVQVRGRHLQVRVAPGSVEYQLLSGEEITFLHCGEPARLSAAAPRIRLPMRMADTADEVAHA